MTARGPAVTPFRGLRYDPQKVGDLARVVAPPYDVISPALQGALYEKSPYNVVRLILARRHGAEDPEHYRAVAGVLARWMDERVLIRDLEPSLYLYEETFTLPRRPTLTRRGFLALCRLEELGAGRVFPHEETLPGPKRDRLALLKECRTNLSPVFALYDDSGGRVMARLNPSFQSEPLVSLEDDERVRHRMWRVSEAAILQEVSRLMEEKKLLLADGHHRYETALAYRRWMEERGNSSPPLQYIMMFFDATDDPGLIVLPTHRLVHNRLLPSVAALEGGLRRRFELRSVSRDQVLASLGPHTLGVALGGGERFWLASWRPDTLKIPLATIGSAVVREYILRDLIGLKPAEEKNPEILTFIKGDEALLKGVEADRNSLGILMAPPPVREIQKIAESGLVLPPKTTYFHPKLLSGLVLNPLLP